MTLTFEILILEAYATCHYTECFERILQSLKTVWPSPFCASAYVNT